MDLAPSSCSAEDRDDRERGEPTIDRPILTLTSPEVDQRKSRAERASVAASQEVTEGLLKGVIDVIDVIDPEQDLERLSSVRGVRAV